MDIEQMADNTTNIKDQFLYTGFIDQDLENETGLGTYDFGETLVMISPLGTFYGYSTNGVVEEVIDQEVIDHLVDDYNTNPVELLMDIDHKSMRAPEERDTTAAGWIYGLVAVKDLGGLSGLYGKVKWTDVGRHLVESRQYRFISPVFEVDEGRPVRIINAALTNRPALNTITPILNTSNSDDLNTTNNDNLEVGENADEIDMTKEEVIELVKDLLNKNSEVAENACSDEEVIKDEVKNEDADTDSIEVKKEDEVVESTPKEESSKDNTENTDNEVADDSTTTSNSEEVKEEVVKQEEKIEDEYEDEVIKEEVLNSAPTIGIDVGSSTKKWQNLHGAEFFKYIETHKNELM